MKKIIIIICLSVIIQACQNVPKMRYEGEALFVTHMPNPSNIHTSPDFPKPPYPYMWYYQTKIENKSDRDLKIIWFESYFEEYNHWYGTNVLNRVLRNDIFMRWYGNENNRDAWFKPGESRICNVNWHGSSKPFAQRIKWAYIAIDRFGNDYYADAIIESAPIDK